MTRRRPDDVPDRDDPGRRRRAGGRRRGAARRRCRRRRGSASRSTGRSTSSAAPRSTRYGVAIRAEDVAACGEADAILLGAVGGPKWADPGATVRPEQALFALRGGLGLFANLRPVTRPAGARRRRRRSARSCSTGVDMLIVRELTGGHLLRRPDRGVGPSRARGPRSTRCRTPSTRSAGSSASRSSWRAAGAARSPRSTRPTSSRRRGCGAGSTDEIAAEYPDVELDHQLVDSCAMLLDPPAGRLRRHRHREPVRRHPVRRGGGPRRAARHAAVGVARRAADGARHVRPVRADPRLRAGHRRPGHRQPDRDDPVGGDAAARSLGRADAADAIEAAVGARAGRRLADGRPGRPGRRRPTGWSSSARPAFATAVIEALEAGAAGRPA